MAVLMARSAWRMRAAADCTLAWARGDVGGHHVLGLENSMIARDWWPRWALNPGRLPSPKPSIAIGAGH